MNNMKINNMKTNNNQEVIKGSELIRLLEKRQMVLAELIEKKSSFLKQAPEGGVKVLKRKNSFEYYWRKEPKGKREYLQKKDIETAIELAQKDYDEKVIMIIKKDLKKIEDYLGYLQSDMLTDIYTNMVPGRRILIDPVYLPEDEYILKWKSVDWDKMPFDESVGAYYSDGGVRVRSKSELLIANALEKYDIPFRYEFPVNLRNAGKVRPDFYCLNVQTRKEYIWEHFGMMDNIAYSNKNIQKIEDYEISGYTLGDNFIATFESSQHPINTNIIKSKIHTYLV